MRRPIRVPANHRAIDRAKVMILALLALLVPGLAACGDAGSPDDGDADDFGIEGELYPDEPLGKADNAGVAGPKVSTWTADTQVWSAKNAWEDTTTAAANAAGIAWPANSGLTWEQKYEKWIQSMPRTAGYNTYYETFTLTTPWGKTLPAPKLECAELAMFLRITFASWYQLPFYMTAIDSKGARIYFGHFGARTKTSRYSNTPLYGQWYKDYSHYTLSDIADKGWPRDEQLRERGIYGGGDDMPFVEDGAVAGTYFDEVYLNKRVGHFMRLILAYFGSMHLAGSRNTYNAKAEVVRPGDVLVERWQRNGIGHTLVVKEVRAISGGVMEAELVSGSMPRRQPKWESPVGSKSYFTSEQGGGEGTNSDGEEYVKLGGGLKRFRVTKNIGGYWTNSWMGADEASWINDTDYASLKVRPTLFQSLLGQVDPEDFRDALVEVIEDARNHLRQYPASCSARNKREDAFDKLYTVAVNELGMTKAQVDAQFRLFEDYVFKKLEYTQSKTCCWNSTNSAMYQIVMDYNEQLTADQCVEPEVFKCSGGGYQVFAAYAAQTGRSHLWKAWSEDETCAQRNVQNDTTIETSELGWCAVEAAGGGGGNNGGGCADDSFEDNDSQSSAASVSSGNHGGLMVCSGDDDYFAVSASGSLTVNIDFAHSEGDIDLAIYQGGQRVGLSQSVSNHESVTVNGGGTYQIRVYGYNGAQAAYALSVQ